MSVDTWVNGMPQTMLPVSDRSVHYGDGFFTTILVQNKQLLNWSGHWQRIENSSLRLKLPLIEKLTLQAWITKALMTYFQENKSDNCVVKIIISRGSGGIGYQAPEKIELQCCFIIKPSPNSSFTSGDNDAIETTVCQVKASISEFAGLKTLNRLENVMARTEITNQGYFEGIMLNHNQQVISGTQSNIFIIKDKTIFTPFMNVSGVEGTTRNQLLTLLPGLGYQVKECLLDLDEIYQADELFFCNAVRGILPVSKLTSTKYTIKQVNGIQQAWLKWQNENAIPIHSLKTK